MDFRKKINFLLDEMINFHPNDPRGSYFYDMVEYLFKTDYNKTIAYIKTIKEVKYIENIHSTFERLSIYFGKEEFIDVINEKAKDFSHSKLTEHIFRSVEEAESLFNSIDENYSDYKSFFEIKKIVNHLIYTILQKETICSYRCIYLLLLEDMLKLNCDRTIEYMKSIEEREKFIFVAAYFENISAHFSRPDFIITIKNKSKELFSNKNEGVLINIEKAENKL